MFLHVGMGLYYENKKLELQDVLAKVSEDDANKAVLADLQQRQEGEFIMVLDDIAQKVIWWLSEYPWFRNIYL